MTIQYPPVKKTNVEDNFHGTVVPDPYRWMEDPYLPETKAFITAQNELLQAWLADAPDKETMKSRLEELWNYQRYDTPKQIGDLYFYTMNDGLQNQPILYMQVGQGEPEVLLDPNLLSEDGTVALMSQSYTKDGGLLAYTLSESGSDRQVIKVRDTKTKQDLPDLIQWCRFTEPKWLEDSSGFFYTRYPEPGTVAPEDQTNFNQVYFHQLGDPQSADLLIYESKEQKELSYYPFITHDQTSLMLYVFHGTDRRNGLLYRPLEDSGAFQTIRPHKLSVFDPIEKVGNLLFIRTDLDAPKGKIITVDLSSEDFNNFSEVIPEKEDTIAFASIIHNHLVVVYKHHARHTMYLYTLSGTLVSEVELPDIGTIASIVGNPDDPFMFFTFSSFLYPKTIFKYDFLEQSLIPYPSISLPIDTSQFVTRQEFYTSKDGTIIPMFLVHKKDFKPTGSTPTILYAYGGFNISQLPEFQMQRIHWLKMGGLFVLANIRGGDEYGETWHQAGMLANKQNVFDDFIAAAEHLINAGYTQTANLAIEGRSNGGLLVGACMLQRPDLFGAVLCHVGVHDMLRFHKYTVGRYWTPEYGNAEEDAEQFDFMFAFSPLHNVKDGVTYPPILLTTADTDDRVVPMHSLKFTATLQEKATSENPILLRVETSAGHGLGKPTSKLIDERIDIFAFLKKTIW